MSSKKQFISLEEKTCDAINLENIKTWLPLQPEEVNPGTSALQEETTADMYRWHAKPYVN